MLNTTENMIENLWGSDRFLIFVTQIKQTLDKKNETKTLRVCPAGGNIGIGTGTTGNQSE